MPAAPYPGDEAARLAALKALQILDSNPEPQFDALVHAASMICNSPVALISLVDAHRQWFKANAGLPGVSETPRDMAFCSHAILQSNLFEVPDARKDPRFIDNPLVTGHPDIRFYAGAPIQLSDGSRVGTLCVIDRESKRLSDTQKAVLRGLAAAAAHLLEGKQALQQCTAVMDELVVSEARFRALSDNSPLGIYYTDQDGACTYTNRQWQRIYGLTLAESLGQGWAGALHPQDQAAVYLEWQRAAAGRIAFDMHFRILRPDGVARHVHSYAQPVFGPGKQIIGHVGSVEDVTEREFEAQVLKNTLDRLALATESGKIGIWDFDLTNHTLVWDTRMYQLYGIDPRDDTETYELWRRHLHPDDRDAAEQAVQEAIAGSNSFDTEFRIVWANGDVRYLRASAHVTRDPAGNALRMIGANWDITDMRRLAVELANEHELLRVTLQSIGDAVITTDSNGHIEWLNPVAERMTGWLDDEAHGRPLTQVFHILNEETRQPAANPVATCIANDKAVGLANHTLLVSRDGAEYGIEDSASPIRNDKGEVLGVVLVFHDVTEQRRLSAEMSHRAAHDMLTGLVNRPEFETRLQRVLSSAHENLSEHALMYIDLDQFKLVNDACGHAVGDQMLQQVSKLLGDAVRARDTLARMGGDEFAVILEYCSTESAKRIAQQVCDRMEEFRFIHDGRRFRIGTSIGLVPIDSRWRTTAAILQAADTSCYAAKEAGRNRVHIWFDTDTVMRARNGETQWATRIEHALDDHRFVLFAQRISPLREAPKGVRAEVLLRMIEADGSLVLPGAFLPAAERFHLASRIDRWVLSAVIAWMRTMPSLDVIEDLGVNLSGQSIGDRAFHRWAIEILSQAGPAICSKLCLEITETAAVTNLADAALFIEQVHAVGVRVALDDFGAGASSFGYLKSLAVDFLKIDGQFIRDLVSDPLDAVAVRCFIDVARTVNVKTIAEFVDKPEVLTRLREIEVDFAQGFLIHQPAPIEELAREQCLEHVRTSPSVGILRAVHEPERAAAAAF
jgi:diguanylate cyclase